MMEEEAAASCGGDGSAAAEEVPEHNYNKQQQHVQDRRKEREAAVAAYAALRCVGRWGELLSLLATARREEAEAEPALRKAQDDADAAEERLLGLLLVGRPLLQQNKEEGDEYQWQQIYHPGGYEGGSHNAPETAAVPPAGGEGLARVLLLLKAAD